MATTRQRREEVLSRGPPHKMTQDSGLGHQDGESYLDNRKKVFSKDHSIINYIS